MFIESITLNGMLRAVSAKKRDFKFFGSSQSENEEDFVNTIDDKDFIMGFSLIFDRTYDEKFNFNQFININSNEDPTVEIRLYARDTDDESNYQWLLKNKLVLKRNLKSPETLLVNNKKVTFEKFHAAMDNLGFTSIESLSIHRLLDVEVTKLGYLVGDDLWSMLMKIIACEELIEMMERKKGIVKKRALKRTFNSLTEKVVQILPKKTKLKKDIQTQLTLQNQFFGLLEIIQARHDRILTNQIDIIDGELEPLYNEIKEKYFEQHKKEKEFASNFQQRENIRNLRFSAEKVHNAFDEAISEISQYTPPSHYLEDFLDIVNESTKLDLDKNDNFELIGWKMVLKESDEEDFMVLSGAVQVSQEIENILNEFNNEIDQDISSLEDKIESLSTENLLKEMKEHFANEKKYVSVYLNTEEDIVKLRLKIAGVVEKINQATFILQIPPQLKSDLMIIEDLVHCDEDLKKDYLGPLFKFLDSSAMSCKLWPQLMSAANIIFFKTEEAALRTTFIFYELKSNSSCTLIGIDKYKGDSENIDSNYTTAMTLIKADVEEPLKTVLASILSKYVLAEGEIPKLNDLNITHYDEIISTIHHEGSTAVISQLSNTIWSKLNTNPINALGELYSWLEKRNIVSERIKDYEANREEAKKELRGQELSILNKMTKDKVKKIFSTILHSMLISNKQILSHNRNHVPFQDLIGLIATDFDNWDVEELRNELENNLYENSHELIDEDAAHPLKLLHSYIINHDKGTPQLFEDINKSFYKMKCKAIKEKLKMYQKFHNNLNGNIEAMCESSIGLINKIDFDHESNYEIFTKFGFNYAQKCSINALIDYMTSCAQSSIVTKAKQEMFRNFQNKSNEEVLNKITQVHASLYKEKSEKNLRLTNLTAESYTKLVESIEKVPRYANEEVFTPLEVKKRAFPMMNFLVVKMLRDTVHHFKTSYNAIFSDYLSQSSLFFYTHGEINEELEEDKFSWSCFDMTRLRSIDFVDKWEGSHRSKFSIEKIKQIKAFLLILHMINYISIFKFIIVSSKIFEELSETLETRIRAFLKAISTYVQVIIIEETRRDIEPMDTSE